MIVETTPLLGVLVIVPTTFRDSRGSILQSWSADRYTAFGLPPFVQDSALRSAAGVLRGLHLQHPGGQGKLVYALEGEVYDVAVDLRRGSATFGRSVAVVLSAQDHRQIYIPPGFAHGFQVLSQGALLMCKYTAYDRPESALRIRWDDPEIGVDWPLPDPTLSDKDRQAPWLREVASSLPLAAE